MIYFDHAATSPISKAALEGFNAATTHYANPNSLHYEGRLVANYLSKIKEKTLALLGLEKTHDIIFTSGATEANNLAIKGVLEEYKNRGKSVISSEAEHPSVKRIFEILNEEKRINLKLVPLNDDAGVSASNVLPLIDDDTVLVSLMAVNNETGALSEITSISRELKRFPKVIFHTDITQAIAKTEIDYSDVDILTYSSHKFGGPVGSGAIIYRKTLKFKPLFDGGDQQGGMRPGTLSYPLALASYLALEDSIKRFDFDYHEVKKLHDYLYDELSELKDDVVLNSHKEETSPFIINFSLSRKKASVVVEALSEKGIYVSSVSACSSELAHHSYVLEASGHSLEDAENSIRISFSFENTLEEAKAFMKVFKNILSEVKDRG